MGLTVYGCGGKPEEEKTVTAGTSVIEVLPSSGKTMKKVNVNPTPTEEKTITAGTSATMVTPTSGKYIKKVTVNPTPSQSKTVTPSTSQQTVSPDSGKLLSQVIVKAMEDVTPEVTAQTPVITQIAENLGVTITTPSGTNKQILQGNNTNLLNIKNNAKKEGLYVWKKLTAEGGTFIDYVTDDNSNKYPDGGTHTDGYWYEKADNYPIVFSKFNSSGYPTSLKVKTGNIPEKFMYMTTNPGFSYGNTFCNYLENVEIDAEEIKSDAFSGTFHLVTTNLKLKIKAVTLTDAGFHSIGKKNSNACKIWIGNKCVTIKAGSYNIMPFRDVDSNSTIYCEPAEKPSGWDSYWNCYDTKYNTLTTMWGVTEEAFDAL